MTEPKGMCCSYNLFAFHFLGQNTWEYAIKILCFQSVFMWHGVFYFIPFKINRHRSIKNAVCFNVHLLQSHHRLWQQDCYTEAFGRAQLDRLVPIGH